MSLPRRESKTGRGHKGFEVIGDPHLDPKEAARRRDFTINAISWDPLRETYLDPFNGRYDLADRVLRVVDPMTFGDDSLRVLRALQFAARFDARISPGTAASLPRGLRSTTCPRSASGARWRSSCCRPTGRRCLRLALELGVVDKLWPELRPWSAASRIPSGTPRARWVHT